jgi:hypothetical protein
MADTYITIGSTGMKKKVVDLGDGTYADAVVEAAPAHADELIVAGPSSELGKLMATDSVLDTETIFVRCPADTRSYGTIDWRVKADQIHSIQKYRSHNIVDSVTITLVASLDGETGFVNGVTFTAEDTVGSALRSLNYFWTGDDTDTHDAENLAACINYGGYVTIGTVAEADTITINGVTFTAAATADIPNGVFSQAGTATQDAASLVLAINHKDTVTFLTDSTAIGGTHPATDTTTEAYALSIDLIAKHNTHTALTTHHHTATAAASSVAATTEETLKAQVLVSRTAMLAHYNDATAHGQADTVNAALVAATAATYANAAAAVVALNLLMTACEAHFATATCTAKAGDTVVINNGISSHTFTGHATTTTKATRTFSTATSVTATGDELAACINDRATITFATCVANNTVVINGLTFKGKASTAVAKDRRFSIDTGNTETAVSLAACINDATYGVPGVTATAALAVVTLIPTYGTTITMATGIGGATIVCKPAYGVEGITATNAAGIVSLTRNSAAYTVATTSAMATLHPHYEAQVVVAHGVPGVLATSNVAEVDIAPTWADGQDFTFSVSANTMTWGRYGVPGVTATNAANVVTIVPKAVNGATCIYSKTGTAAGTWAVGQTTVAGLTLDGDETHGAIANSTISSGKIYEQELHGYEQGYISVNNHDAGGDKMIVTVGATLH